MPEMTFGQMREAAASQGFEPHPVGEYLFKVDTSEVVPGKGSNQIRIRLVNQNGPHANKSVLNRLVPYKNNGEVNGMFFQQLKALGFPDTDPIWGQLEQLGLDQGLSILAQQLPGRYSVCVIEHDDWGGETRDNVKRMKPYSGAAPGMPVVGGAVPVTAQAPQPGPPAAVQPIAPAAPPAPPMAPTPVPAPVAQEPAVVASGGPGGGVGISLTPGQVQVGEYVVEQVVVPVPQPQEGVVYDVAGQPVVRDVQPYQGFVGNGGGTPPGGQPVPPAPQPMEVVTVPVVPTPQPPVAPVTALPQPNVPTPPEDPFSV